MVDCYDLSKAYKLYDSQTQQLIVSREMCFVEPNGKNVGEIPILKNSPEVEREQVPTKMCSLHSIKKMTARVILKVLNRLIKPHKGKRL